MSDQIEKGREFEKKADKMLNGWGFFGSKFKYAGDLYEKAANSYKLAKSYYFLIIFSRDQAGSVYVKLADCHLKMDSKMNLLVLMLIQLTHTRKQAPRRA